MGAGSCASDACNRINGVHAPSDRGDPTACAAPSRFVPQEPATSLLIAESQLSPPEWVAPRQATPLPKHELVRALKELGLSQSEALEAVGHAFTVEEAIDWHVARMTSPGPASPGPALHVPVGLTAGPTTNFYGSMSKAGARSRSSSRESGFSGNGGEQYLD